MVGHIDSTDFSAYGYVGQNIEQMDIKGLKNNLDYYTDPKHLKTLNQFSKEKSLLDLALDNFLENPEKAKPILDILMARDIIDLNIVDKKTGHSFLSSLLTIIPKVPNKDLQNFLLKKIDTKKLDPDVLLNLQDKEFQNAIKCLKDNNKKSLADRLQILNAIQKGDLNLVKKMVDADPKILETTSHNANLLKFAAINDRHDIQDYLINKGLNVNFELEIRGKKIKYLNNLIHNGKNGANSIKILIARDKIDNLLNEKNIVDIYLESQKKPATAGYTEIFNDLLDKGLLDEYLNLKIQSAGFFGGANITIKDFALNNLDVPKLNVLLRKRSLNFTALTDTQKNAVVELFSKHYESLDKNKQSLQAEVLNYAIKQQKWEVLNKLFDSNAVVPKDLNKNNAEIIIKAYLDDKLKSKLSDKNLVKLMKDNLENKLSKNHGKHGAIQTKDFTILHAAALKNDKTILKGLLNTPDIKKTIDIKTAQNQTPLSIAMQLGHNNIGKDFVEAGADLKQVKEVQSGIFWGVHEQEANPLQVALSKNNLDLASKIVASKNFTELGNDKEKKIIYDLLKKNITNQSHVDLLKNIIQKDLLPSTIGGIDTLTDLSQVAIEHNKPKLLENLIRYNKFSPGQLKKTADLMVKDKSLNLVEFSKIILTTMPTDKKAKLTELLVKNLIANERYSDLTNLRKEKLVAQDLISKHMPENSILRLYNSDAETLLKAQLDKANKEQLSQTDPNGSTMLHSACYSGQSELAKTLFAKGADPFTPNNKGMTPLMMLAVSKHPRKAKEIFENFSKNPEFVRNSKKAKDDFMPTLLALKNNNIALANAFIKALEPQKENYKDINEFNDDKKKYDQTKATIHTQIFYRAINSNDTELVKNFLKLESSKEFNPTYIELDINSNGKKNTYYLNPLFTALRNDNVEILTALLNSSNPNINLNNIDYASVEQYTLLQEAMLLGKDKSVKALLEVSNKTQNSDQKLKLNLSTQIGKEKLTPINLAYNRVLELEAQEIKEVDPEKKKKLLKEIGGIYKSMNLLLTYNQGKGKPDQRIDINASLKVELIDPKNNEKRKFNIITDSYQRLMDERSKKKPNQEKIDQLEEFILNILHAKDVNLDITNEYGQNLLMLASQYGDLEIVAAVALNKQSRPEINQADHLGNTALFYAAQSGNPKIYKYLTEEGAKPTVNKKGTTALMAACNNGNLKIIELLKPKIKDLNTVDNKKNTALHYLVTNNIAVEKETEDKKAERTKILDKFISLGADINARNAEGKSPLILAVMSGDVPTVRKLLQNGADVNLADKDGNTALIYACLLNNKFMIETLLEDKTLQVNRKNNSGISPYVIAASRRGLEKFKASKNFKNTPENAKINQIEGNTYPKLVETLIDRGADPYDSDPNPLVWNVIKTIAKSSAMSAANHYLFKSTPICQEVGKSIIAGYTAKKMYDIVGEKAETLVKNLLTSGTELDTRIDLQNKLMIGTFHNKGSGRVAYGESLRKEVGSHKNFRNTDAGIYTVKQLRESLQKQGINTPVWQKNAHEMLTAKYISVTETLNNRPWYKRLLIWNTRALKRVAKEILQADELLLKQDRKLSINNVHQSFEDFFGNEPDSLLTIIKSPKTSKQLLSAMLQHPKAEYISNTEKIIDLVVNNKILVAPDTFAAFLKFSQQLQQIKRHKSKSDAFLAANKPLSKSLIKKDTIVQFNAKKHGGASSIAERFERVNNLLVNQAQADKQKISEEDQSISYSQKLLQNVAYFTGQKEKDIVDVTAKTAKHITGTAAGLVSAITVDNKIKTALSVGAATIALIPGSVVVGAGLAVGGGIALAKSAPTLTSWANKIWESLPSFKSEKPQEKVIAPPENIKDASKLDVHTQNLLSGLGIPEIKEHSFDIQPSPPQIEIAEKRVSPQQKFVTKHPKKTLAEHVKTSKNVDILNKGGGGE